MIGLLVISRQIVALIENRQLNTRLRATVEQLSEREHMIAERMVKVVLGDLTRLPFRDRAFGCIHPGLNRYSRAPSSFD